MSEEELININGTREDLYQAMQIGDITLSPKHSQELYDFMNYQDKEIERLSKEVDMWNKKYNEQFDIINELEKYLIEDNYKNEDVWCITTQEVLNKIQELKGSDKE